jgi:hypothetical protein
MNAKYFLLLNGAKAIGMWIETEAMGVYPGGPAQIVDIETDDQIVMTVAHPTWRNEEGKNQIGIFDYEDVFEVEAPAKLGGEHPVS